MPKHLKQFMLFLAILGGLLWGIDGVLSWGAKHNFRSDQGKVNLLFGHRTDPDIMIFGSSNVEVGFDAPLLQRLSGKTAYNAGLDGTHYTQMDCLIREFAQYSTNCRYVMLGMSPFTLTHATKVNEIERFLPQINNRFVFKSLSHLDADLAFKCRFVPFYKYTEVTNVYYRDAAIGLISGLRTKGAPVTDTAEGFTPNYQHWQRDASGNPVFQIPVDTPTFRMMSDLIAELKAKGKKVILVVPPVNDEGRAEITNWAEVHHCFQQLGQKADYYLDFSQSSISSRKEYFYNMSHLNVTGANVFTDTLYEQLKPILADSPRSRPNQVAGR